MGRYQAGGVIKNADFTNRVPTVRLAQILRRKGLRLTFFSCDLSQYTPQLSGSCPSRPTQKWSSGMQNPFSSHCLDDWQPYCTAGSQKGDLQLGLHTHLRVACVSDLGRSSDLTV